MNISRLLSSTLVLIAGLGAVAFFQIDGAGALSRWIEELTRRPEAAKPSKPVPTPLVPLVPLEQQIAHCRAPAYVFDRCMMDAGYAVNSDWIDAHNEDGRQNSALRNPQHVVDVTKDKYIAGPGATYGVQYWIPRPPKKK